MVHLTFCFLDFQQYYTHKGLVRIVVVLVAKGGMVLEVEWVHGADMYVFMQEASHIEWGHQMWVMYFMLEASHIN